MSRVTVRVYDFTSYRLAWNLEPWNRVPPSRLPKGKRPAGVKSGAGNLTRPVSLQGGPGDSLTVRDRGVSEVAHLLYIRAGKVRERDLGLPFGPFPSPP